jgi:hypothetical protein
MSTSDVLIVVNIALVTILNSIYQYKLGYRNGKSDTLKENKL